MSKKTVTEMIRFFVNGKSHETVDHNQSVKDILEIAGLPSDKFILVTPDGSHCNDAGQVIELQPGDQFTTEQCDPKDVSLPVNIISYKVNGEPQSTTHSPLSLETILRSAGKAASIDLAQLKYYYLQNLITEETYQNLADAVKIQEGDEFIAVHVGATPVA